MKRKIIQFAAVFLALTLCLPTVWAARTDSGGNVMIRVGLASSSSHNAEGEKECAHLQNNTGYGSGFRFGYYDDSLSFVELARTSAEVTQVAMMKTQNMGYGRDSAGKTTYSTSISSDITVGCYHIQIPGGYASYRDAAEDAALYGGFVAWIDGSYQIRVGSFTTKEDAEAALANMAQGTVVGTSAYGINVVETGTDHILFQFDGGSGRALGVLPDVTGVSDVRTWFSGYKYRGGFTYQRVTGGNLTVVNVLDLESYVKGVTPYEMGRLWPLEALKTQAVCARTYVLRSLNTHGSLGFDVCNSASCQAYCGVGSSRADYGASDLSDRAVEETAGQVVTYNGSLADTYYSSSHGGASEEVSNIWGNNKPGDYPYLCGVIDPYEASVASINAKSSWKVTYSAAQLAQRLQGYGYGINASIDHLTLTYSKLGNVLKIVVHWDNGKTNTFSSSGSSKAKTDIRYTFGVDSIHFTVNGASVTPGTSTPAAAPTANGYLVNGSGSLNSLDGAYTISGAGTVGTISGTPYAISGSGQVAQVEQPSEDNSSSSGGSNEGGGTVTTSGSSYVFAGGGWGHQVGMSQFGANAMAKQGFTYDQILKFYFPGVQVGTYRN